MDVREATGCMCLAVRRASRRLTQIYDQALAPSGLTINQFGLLSYLFGYGPLPVGRAAELLGMDATTVNRLVQPLQAAALVTVGANRDDRRVRLLTLTRAGEQRLRDAFPRWQVAQAAVTQELPVADADVLPAILGRAASLKNLADAKA